MRKLLYLLLLLSINNLSFPQNSDEEVIRDIFDNVLLSDVAYNNLDYLCEYAPGRLLGSEESVIAVNFMKEYFENLGADNVFLQEFSTPAWKCNSTEVSFLVAEKEVKLRADALGPSLSTPENGLLADVIEVQSLDEVKTLGVENIKGKIVFYNRPVNLKLVNTFSVYSSAIDQRYYGPRVAAEMGAVGVLVRSVGTRIDTFPHTGSTGFKDIKIPCAAISTVDANLLSTAMEKENGVKVKMKIDAEYFEQINTYNLIADIKGSEFPDEYIIVAGHIDSWFNSPGAHDDGVGCVQAADVLRIFKELGLNNRRSIRAIMYMDEELFQSGANAYLKYSEDNSINNYLALEADAGGFTPEGFSIDASDSIVNLISKYYELLEPYGINYIKKGGSGVDIGPLKQLGVPLMGYRTDPQRYMDLHHSAYDTFDKVHIRELQLGSGNMAAIIYLIDKYGL